jgi:chromosome segregation ATPase
MVFQKVEQELRYKLSQIGDQQNDERCDLLRRIEDLQSEVHHLANTKTERDDRLKAQVSRNEQLLSELERLNMELTQAKEDKEQTLQ